jgi:RNA polymerase sigma-70 factor (ECF subfamily)
MPNPELRTQFEAALSTEVYGAAWRYAWRLAAAGRGGCREEAEDLLQEALTHAWRQFGQLRERTQFKAWLLSIVRTRYLDRLRAQRRRPQVAGEVPAELGAPESDGLGAGMGTALALLAAGERELLTLFYCEGLSLAETGTALGLSARVVRQRLYRARGALRQAWERLHGAGSGISRAAGQAAQPGTSPRRTSS